MSAAPAAVRTEKLSKGYGRLLALDLDVRPGKIFGLLDPTERRDLGG